MLLAFASAGQTAIVFAAALITALATGLGAVPFALRRGIPASALGTANALAGGVMAGASIALFVQGSELSWVKLLIGVAAGALFLMVVGRVLDGDAHEHAFNGMTGADARKGLLIVVAMTVHSAAEGVGVGAGFGGGDKLGWLLTIAIAIHNIPEGLAISLVLVPRGSSALRAGLWSIFTSLPQPLLAVPAFLFVERFTGLVPVGLGFAGGAMLWLAATELVPEALKEASPRRVAAAGTLAAAAMVAFQLLLL